MECILVGLFTGLKGRVQIFVVIQIMAGVQQGFMIGFQTAVIIVLVSDTVGQQIAAAAFVRRVKRRIQEEPVFAGLDIGHSSAGLSIMGYSVKVFRRDVINSGMGRVDRPVHSHQRQAEILVQIVRQSVVNPAGDTQVFTAQNQEQRFIADEPGFGAAVVVFSSAL